MRQITQRDYLDLLTRRDFVSVGTRTIRLLGPQHPKTLQPDGFQTETTTLWSFPVRGRWATHRAGFRGNWAPQIARNLVLRYSAPGDLVLDQMCGGGTTLVECRLTGRNAIGVDISTDALMLTMDRLNFSPRLTDEPLPPSEVRVYRGDARNLDLVADESVDLIATHPPYADIISYAASDGPSTSLRAGPAEGDLSRVRDIAEFAAQMRLVADECLRVLKPDHYCAILVGDTRRGKHYVPIAYRVMQSFLEAGFVLKEEIIKAQHNTQTEGLWAKRSRELNFLLIMHEHLFVFRKPGPGERTAALAESRRWW